MTEQEIKVLALEYAVTLFRGDPKEYEDVKESIVAIAKRLEEYLKEV